MSTLLMKLRMLWLALFDRRVPPGPKLALIFSLLYGLTPFDLVPDLLPLLGQLDDLGVLVMALWIFYKAASKLPNKKG